MYLLDCNLKIGGFVVELSTDVDVGSPSPHGTAGNEAAFDKLVRVVTHDFAVLASAGLALEQSNHWNIT